MPVMSTRTSHFTSITCIYQSSRYALFIYDRKPPASVIRFHIFPDSIEQHYRPP